MWENPKRGEAEFRANGWKLIVEADERGVRLLTSRQRLGATMARIWLPQIALAGCCESFIRGDALHLSLSGTQTEPVGLDLVLMAVEADEDLLILESVLSLNTSLLDSHPAVELQVTTGQEQHGRSDVGHPPGNDARWTSIMDEGSAIWLHAQPHQENQQVTTSVLCDERDRLSLDRQRVAEGGPIRFFGDFLEKGVIRKVQPWWVWSHRPISPQLAARIAGQLAVRPLPLTN